MSLGSNRGNCSSCPKKIGLILMCCYCFSHFVMSYPFCLERNRPPCMMQASADSWYGLKLMPYFDIIFNYIVIMLYSCIWNEIEMTSLCILVNDQTLQPLETAPSGKGGKWQYCTFFAEGMHFTSRWTSRLPDGQCMLGTLLLRAWNRPIWERQWRSFEWCKWLAWYILCWNGKWTASS